MATAFTRKYPDEGKAFPTNPRNRQKFWRTDLDLECYWNPTAGKWLTTHEYQMRHTAQSLSTGGGEIGCTAPADLSQAGMWITRQTIETYVSTTNTGVHYWTVQPATLVANETATGFGSSFNTSADTASNDQTHAVTHGAAVPSTTHLIAFTYTKNGTPGAITTVAVTHYRLIVA